MSDGRISLNEGKPMRLLNPFTTIAVHEGAIQLWSDDGAVLMVPADAKAILNGIRATGLPGPRGAL